MFNRNNLFDSFQCDIISMQNDMDISPSPFRYFLKFYVMNCIFQNLNSLGMYLDFYATSIDNIDLLIKS